MRVCVCAHSHTHTRVCMYCLDRRRLSREKTGEVSTNSLKASVFFQVEDFESNRKSLNFLQVKKNPNLII